MTRSALTAVERMMLFDSWVRGSFEAAGRDASEDEVTQWRGELEAGRAPDAVREAILSKAA